MDILPLYKDDSMDYVTNPYYQDYLGRVTNQKPKYSSENQGIFLGKMSKGMFLASKMFKRIPNSCIWCKDTGNVMLPV